MKIASATLNTIGAFYNAPDKAALDRQRVALAEKFETLEDQLRKHDGPYFAGADFCLVDAAFGPVFRYFDVFDSIRDFRTFENAPRVVRWREVLAQRTSVRDAVARDYPERLRAFLLRRNSALSGLMLNAEPSIA